MYYLIYLVGIIGFVFLGIKDVGFNTLLDFPTLLPIIGIILLALLTTKSFKDLGNAFVFVFGKKDLTKAQKTNSYCAIKITMKSALYSGIIEAIMYLVATTAMLNEGFNEVILAVSVAFCPLFVGFIIYLILYPIKIMLKKEK